MYSWVHTTWKVPLMLIFLSKSFFPILWFHVKPTTEFEYIALESTQLFWVYYGLLYEFCLFQSSDIFCTTCCCCAQTNTKNMMCGWKCFLWPVLGQSNTSIKKERGTLCCCVYGFEKADIKAKTLTTCANLSHFLQSLFWQLVTC